MPGQPHRITVIPGDGVGPEVVRSAQRIIAAAGVAIDWEEAEAGAEVFKRGDTSGVPQETRESIERTRVVLKGPLETPGRLRGEERQRHAAQALRDVRQRPPGAGAARRPHPLRGRRRRHDHRPREHRGPVRRHRAHADAGRRAVPEDHHPQGQREDHPLRLRAGPPGGAPEGHLRDQGEHHEAHRGPLQADLRGARRRVPGDHGPSTSSSTTSPTRWPRTRPSSTSSSRRTSTATSSATSPRGWSAGSASRRPATTATTWRSSRPSTARRPSTPARTSSTRRRSSSRSLMMLRHIGEPAAAAAIENAVLVTLEQGKAVTQDLARQTGGDVEHAASTTGFTDSIIANLGQRPATVPARAGGERPADAATPRPRWSYGAERLGRRAPRPRSASTSSSRRWEPADVAGPALEALAGDRAAAPDDLEPRDDGLAEHGLKPDNVGLLRCRFVARGGRCRRERRRPQRPRRAGRRNATPGRTSRSSTSSPARTASRRPRASRDGGRSRRGRRAAGERRGAGGSARPAPVVGIVGGSRSDFPVLEKAKALLDELGRGLRAAGRLGPPDARPPVPLRGDGGGAGDPGDRGRCRRRRTPAGDARREDAAAR